MLVGCYVLYMCRPAMLPGRVYLQHASLAPAHVLGCYHGVARNWGAALPRCMPVCGFYSISAEFRLCYSDRLKPYANASLRSHAGPFEGEEEESNI